MAKLGPRLRVSQGCNSGVSLVVCLSGVWGGMVIHMVFGRIWFLAAVRLRSLFFRRLSAGGRSEPLEAACSSLPCGSFLLQGQRRLSFSSLLLWTLV